MKKIFILLIVLITSNILLAQSPFYGDRMFISKDGQDTLYLKFENDSVKFISSKNISFSNIANVKWYEVEGGIAYDSNVEIIDTLKLNGLYRQIVYLPELAQLNDTINKRTLNITPQSDYTGSTLYHNMLDFKEVFFNENSGNRLGKQVFNANKYEIYNTNDSIAGNVYGSNILIDNLKGYMNYNIGGYSLVRLKPTGVRAKTENQVGYAVYSYILPQSSAGSYAICNNSKALDVGSNIGNSYLTDVGDAYLTNMVMTVNSKSGATTNIDSLKLLNIELKSAQTAGTRNLLSNYGLYLSNTSGLTGSVNDYGIYENYGKNYFTHEIQVADTARFNKPIYIGDNLVDGTSSSVTLGDSYQIPYMNPGATDLAYSPNFTWNDTTLNMKSSLGTDNIFIGENNGTSITTGINNTTLGTSSGKFISTGANNVFNGYYSGFNNTTGSTNVFLGYRSGFDNLIGSNNVSVGAFAGEDNKNNNNTFLGTQSGQLNQNGSNNVFVGYKSGYNETGSNKLYIDNSSTSTPLIYGDMEADSLEFNADVNINGKIYQNGVELGGGSSYTSAIQTLNDTVEYGYNKIDYGIVDLDANTVIVVDSTNAEFGNIWGMTLKGNNHSVDFSALEKETGSLDYDSSKINLIIGMWHPSGVSTGARYNIYKQYDYTIPTPSPDPLLNPVAEWIFNNTLTADNSGNGYTLTNYGGMLAEDRHSVTNNALYLSNVSVYMDITGGNILTDFGDSVSISFWFKDDSWTTNQTVIRLGGFVDGEAGFYVRFDNNTTVRFALRNQTGNEVSTTTVPAISTNVWHHLVATATTNSKSIWIDNVEYSSSISFTADFSNNNTEQFIGILALPTTYGLEGWLDDIRIYNRVLTPTEINILYNE